jgi:predicted thioesterase
LAQAARCRRAPIAATAAPDIGGTSAGLTTLPAPLDLTVGEEHTAPSVGSGAIHVLGTPVMINLMEAAALDAAEHLLPAGHQSLGIHLDVSHLAATPVGMKVQATAQVTAVEGNRIKFRVEARDETDLIGEGTHERVVVNVERFDKRVRQKAGEG